LGELAGSFQQLALTVNHRVPPSWRGSAGNPRQLKLTLNLRCRALEEGLPASTSSSS
jgi:hypothetical protein